VGEHLDLCLRNRLGLVLSGVRIHRGQDWHTHGIYHLLVRKGVTWLACILFVVGKVAHLLIDLLLFA
jgi:hypothetical protein